MISYVVSVFDRLHTLKACLSCLAIQQHTTEIVVCCNGDAKVLQDCVDMAAVEFEGIRVEPTGLAGAKTCYESANMVAPGCKGEWLCFPSDDSLYVSAFAEIMIETAKSKDAELVYCDCVYALGSEVNMWPAYSVLSTSPHMCKIDKTCFLVKRELFKGFPPHPRFWQDGALIESLMEKKVRHAKAPGVLCVHQ